MKIKVSAKLPEEERDFQNLKAYIKAQYPGAKVHETDAQPPYKVLFLTVKKPENPSDCRENT